MEELNKKSFTEEARQKSDTYHPNEWTEEDQKHVYEQYRFVKQELGSLVAQRADPASPEAQYVEHIKRELVVGFSKGDQDIEASVGKWWEEFEALPKNQRPLACQSTHIPQRNRTSSIRRSPFIMNSRGKRESGKLPK